MPSAKCLWPSYTCRMKRLLYLLPNALGGVVLVLLLLDPVRPLGPVFVLVAAAVVCALLPGWLR